MPFITISSGLTIKVPTRSTTGWDETLRTDTFAVISSHDHSGSGNGSQLTSAAFADDAIPFSKINGANNDFLTARNAANSADINIIKVNASDYLEFGATVIDSTFLIGDEGDATKALTFSLGGATTAKTMTFISSHTDNRSLTFPDATDTLVGKATTDVLTNKSIDSDNNTITNIVNADIKAAAAIAVNKLAATTANKALASDASGFITASATTDTELGYVSGVTSAIQTQIDTKTDTGTADEITLTGTTIGLADNPILPGTGSATLPKGTTAQRSGSPASGMIRFNTSTSGFEGYDGSAWGEIGGGTAGVNYITDSDAEAGVGSWATYADAAATTPVDGTGGSPTLTFTQNSTTPLRGAADFKLTKDAVNRQGEGASYDFTVDKADLAKVMRIEFDYDASDTDYADDDIIVYIYDKDGTSLIEPVGINLKAGKGTHVSYFQTDSTNNDYRLILHQSSTNAAAYDIYFDRFSVGPATRTYSTPVSDWKDYTPTTGGIGTPTINLAQWRRVGDSAEIIFNITCGTVAASEFQVGLPNSITVATGYSLEYVGDIHNGTATGETHFSLVATAGDAFLNSGNRSAGANTFLSANNGNSQFTTSDVIIGRAVVPISGWGSQVQMSDEADTRVVAAKYSTNAGLTINNTTETRIDFEDKSYDTHGAVTTGGSWVYTIPSSGYYSLSLKATINATTSTFPDGQLSLLKNSAVPVARTGTPKLSGTSARWTYELNDDGYFTKGDTLYAIFYQNSGGSVTLQTSGEYNYFNIHKIQGPSAIAANELVKAHAHGASGSQSISNATWTTMTFLTTELFDSHGALSAGVFTAPVSGTYLFTAGVRFAGNGTGSRSLSLLKNGSTRYWLKTDPASASYNPRLSSSYILELNADDTVAAQVYQDSTGALNIEGAGEFTCHFGVVRQGF